MIKRFVFVILTPLLIPLGCLIIVLGSLYTVLVWPVFYIITGKDFETSDWNLFNI